MTFDPHDPFRLDDQLTEVERMLRDTARRVARAQIVGRAITGIAAF